MRETEDVVDYVWTEKLRDSCTDVGSVRVSGASCAKMARHGAGWQACLPGGASGGNLDFRPSFSCSVLDRQRNVALCLISLQALAMTLEYFCGQFFQKIKERNEAERAKLPNDPIKITLPDGTVKDGIKHKTTPFEIAAGKSQIFDAHLMLIRTCGITCS